MGNRNSKGGSIAESDTDNVDHVNDFWKEWTKVRSLGKGRTCEVVEVKRRKSAGAELGPFACKILKKGKLALKKLFDREVEILKMLNHPNCVRFAGHYQDSDNYYILMTLCQGNELFHRITTSKEPFTEDEGKKISEFMLKSIKHCHDQGIIHRDLKPENFMFDIKDRGSNLRLIDFGSAVIVEDGKSYKELAGTPYYMSPESVRNLDRSEFELKATDVWSIGVITYVLLSRRPPFGGPTNKDIFTKILKYKLKWPRNCKWSYELKDFLRKIIEKDTFKRMTLEEALNHPWIVGTKLKRPMYDLGDGVMEDDANLTIAQRQESRDEPLL